MSDDILKYFSYSSQKQFLKFYENYGISWGDNLHEISNPVFWDKSEKKYHNLLSAEFAQRAVKVKSYYMSSIMWLGLSAHTAL